MEKIKSMAQKFLTKEVILYIVFGVFTTLVNLVIFYVLNHFWGWNENVANFVAIVLAVLFAYVTNKDLVFHSEAESLKDRLTQFARFILGRAFTMIIEFVGGLILFQLPIPNIVVKIGLSVVVIILNFFISKFFAFKNKK